MNEPMMVQIKTVKIIKIYNNSRIKYSSLTTHCKNSFITIKQNFQIRPITKSSHITF